MSVRCCVVPAPGVPQAAARPARSHSENSAMLRGGKSLAARITTGIAAKRLAGVKSASGSKGIVR